MTTLRAHFDGRVLVPTSAVNLPQGQLLEVDVRAVAEAPPGSPVEIARTLQSLPRLSSQDVAELERAIESSSIPPRDEDVFGGHGESKSNP